MGTIVMTGATAGFGRVAAEQLLARPGTRLIVGARGAPLPGAETLPLDLASLEQVRRFADAVAATLGAGTIDSLILNAGLQFADADHRSADGFETTFAVNHLAHYLLLRRLLPRMAEGGTILLTSSGTHDPAEKTIIPPPRHATAELLAHPDRDPDRDRRAGQAGGRAYAASKLCNILTARALLGQPIVVERAITVVAYEPGATPGTGLVRSASWPVRLAWRLPPALLRPILRETSTLAEAGGALADLGTGVIRPQPGRLYATLRGGRISWPDPSTLARDDAAMTALWADSARLVGL
jgi:NAD(P)-dependent dehydrogenase (short-subunit alcohol dehydrogenase family)